MRCTIWFTPLFGLAATILNPLSVFALGKTCDFQGTLGRCVFIGEWFTLVVYALCVHLSFACCAVFNTTDQYQPDRGCAYSGWALYVLLSWLGRALCPVPASRWHLSSDGRGHGTMPVRAVQLCKFKYSQPGLSFDLLPLAFIFGFRGVLHWPDLAPPLFQWQSDYIRVEMLWQFSHLSSPLSLPTKVYPSVGTIYGILKILIWGGGGVPFFFFFASPLVPFVSSCSLVFLLSFLFRWVCSRCYRSRRLRSKTKACLRYNWPHKDLLRALLTNRYFWYIMNL